MLTRRSDGSTGAFRYPVLIVGEVGVTDLSGGLPPTGKRCSLRFGVRLFLKRPLYQKIIFSSFAPITDRISANRTLFLRALAAL